MSITTDADEDEDTEEQDEEEEEAEEDGDGKCTVAEHEPFVPSACILSQTR